MIKKMSENILTAQQVKMVEEAEPHEILFALHKRVVDTEKLMAAYRNHAQNLELEIGMLKCFSNSFFVVFLILKVFSFFIYQNSLKI